MTWTKLGDEFSDEARDMTDAEFRTHVEALLWSNRRGLDLHVPKRDLRRFAESPGDADAADGLVVKGWWDDRGDVWYIGVRFAEWQRERRQVEHRREYLAEAQRRSRAHRSGDHSLCISGKCPLASSGMSTPTSTVTSTVDPGRDGKGLSDLSVPPKTSPRKRDYDDAHFGEFWDAYPRRTDKRRAWGAWQAALKRGADPLAIVKAAHGYAAHRAGSDPQYTKHPATWLNAASYDNEIAPVLAAERDDDSWKY